MKKYNKKAICPKCGNEIIETAYCDSSFGFNTFGKIKRTCEKCRYYWFENPLDEEENKN